MSEMLGELVQAFSGGITHGTLYFKDHPRVQEMAERTHALLAAHLQATGGTALFIGVARGRLVADGKPLLGATLAARRLVDFLRRLKSGGFQLQKEVDVAQLRDLFGLGHEFSGELPSLADARRKFAERGIHAIELSPLFGEPGWLGTPLGGGAESVLAPVVAPDATVTGLQQLHEAVEALHAAVAQGRVPDVSLLLTTVARVLPHVKADLPRALELAQYPDYDRYTIGHSVRVGLLALLVAVAHSVADARTVDVVAAALLHDLGKAKVPPAILHRRGALRDDERRIMERHATDGALLLAAHPAATPLMLEVALAHHVREDGRGYPDLAAAALRGPWAALIYVLDVYEALTAVRPFKPGCSPKRAFEILVADRGGARPAALATCARALGLHPPGGYVRLAGGETARVLAAGRRFERPRIELLRDGRGRPLPHETIDLSLAGQEQRVIAEYSIVPRPFGDGDGDGPFEIGAPEA